MRTIAPKLNLLLAFLLMATLGYGQDFNPTVGIIGPATSGGWNASTPMKLVNASDPHQWILTTLLKAGELKFRANNSWDVSWGGSAFPGGTAVLNGGNIVVPAESYYTISFNDISGNYYFEALNPDEYNSLDIIGSATASGWNAPTPMLPGADKHSWILPQVALGDGVVKFRANDSWGVNWGGPTFPFGYGYQDGPDIAVKAGTYNITFNDVTREYYFENVDQQLYESIEILGSATAGGWETPTPLTLAEPDNQHLWSLTVYLSEGQVKFRANNSWAVNWGSSDFPGGIAFQDGPDITITNSGYYYIRLNDLTGEFTFIRLNPDTYETVGLVGDASPNGWNVSVPMQQGPDGHSWTLEGVVLTGGSAKFRADNEWIVSWGGTSFPEGSANINGENIPVVAGTYNISFNDVTREYIFTAAGANPDAVVQLNPAVPTADEPITIIYDASKGVSGLQGAAKVYMHAGVVLSGPDGTAWSNVVGNWGLDDGIGEMTPVAGAPDKWQITLPGGVREYFNLDEGVPVFRLGMVFRNASGTQIGKSETDGDIFVNLNPGDYVRFTAPASQEVFGVAGEQLQLSAEASALAGTISLEINEGSGFQSVATINNSQTIGYAYTIGTASSLQIRVTAQLGEKTVTAERNLTIRLRQPATIAALPAGMRSGINYHPGDDSKVTLVLLAPHKEFVYVVGDFNNWQISDAYQMNKTPHGEYFWLELTGLEPQKEYVYQYWVEGTIKIGDPYADKVADPFNDASIPAHVYPNPVAYNRTADGIATVLQTGQQPYQWNFPEVAGGRPAKEDLVIYELLLRDFLGSHSYQDLADTLTYLKRLGVNAIELLPIMEFEGNESWGYNPSYLFAPDKYYGTKNDLKAFIDRAHQEGFVVLLDMVLNHQFGQSPMVRMYFDEANARPAAESPWFNPEATHPFNVGYDMNHESPYTKQYIDDVNRYWIDEYKFDGYRFDLSKGFTQTNNPNDVGAWSAYDQSRINILKRMADRIWEADGSAYVILEHLADNSEETELANYGMMLWGNLNQPYNDALNGRTETDLSWVLSGSRGWQQKNLVAYMESHDEERLMVRALNEGGSIGDYNIQDPEIALERIKLASAFYYPLPGPKMIWQFGELGYDFSIDYNGRTGNKPIPWGDDAGLNYDKDEARVKLYKAKAAIIKLVNEYNHVFEEGDFSWTPSGQFRRISVSHVEMNVTIVGNFGLTEGSMEPRFQHTGTWYDFFTGQAVEVTATNSSLTLAPGEFHIYVDKPVNFPEKGLISIYTPIVTVDPGTFSINDQIRITFDAAAANPAGTAGLVGADKVYFVGGLVTDGPESSEVASFMGSADKDDGVGLMTKVPGDNEKWTILLRPREYFEIAAGQDAYRIGMYFRDASGQNLGKGRGEALIYTDIQQVQDVVSVTPAPFTADDEIRIVFDASRADAAGTAGLNNAEKVYMHSALVTLDTDAPTGSEWTNVVGNWGQDDGIGLMSKVAGEDHLWEISLMPRDYYNLDAGTSAYYLAMVFRNADGTAEGKGPGGSDIFIRIAQGATVAPSNLTAQQAEAQSISVSWQDNAAGELGYVLERMSEEEQAFEKLAILDEDVSSYLDVQVVDGVNYQYRVKAVSAFAPDSDWSNIATADLPLLAPDGLAASVADLRTVSLQWQDRSAHETAYVVEKAMQYGNNLTPYTAIAALPAGSNAFTDTGVRPGVLNHYRVMAKDADGMSEYSNAVSVRPADNVTKHLQDQLAQSIRMYPNPAADLLTIATDMQLTEPVRFRITSMQGFVHRSFELAPGTMAGVQTDVSQLKDGMYILQVNYQDISISLLLQVKR